MRLPRSLKKSSPSLLMAPIISAATGTNKYDMVIIIFLPGEAPWWLKNYKVSYKNLFGSAPYSGRSSSIKPSCSKTELNRKSVGTKTTMLEHPCCCCTASIIHPDTTFDHSKYFIVWTAASGVISFRSAASRSQMGEASSFSFFLPSFLYFSFFPILSLPVHVSVPLIPTWINWGALYFMSVWILDDHVDYEL